MTGKKENVEKAVEMLKKIEEELASIVTKELDIPCKVQARLHGGNRRLISDIEEECGGVHIKFPSEKSQSTKVGVLRDLKGCFLLVARPAKNMFYIMTISEMIIHF